MLEKVFIVDEDVAVRDFLYELISEVGFRAITIPKGIGTLDRLKNERPSFIIIDDLPGEDSGFCLAKKIREFDKEVKIIMLGKDPRVEMLGGQFKEADITVYLKKDFQNPALIKNILSALKEESFIRQQGEKKWGRILVVDDESESREMIDNYLSRRGFEVETASSGEECIEKVKQGPFDVVLLDITMEGMDGLLALKHIKEINDRVKIIMVTGLANNGVPKQAQALGASDYIVKPFNLATLESSLLSVLLAHRFSEKNKASQG